MTFNLHSPLAWNRSARGLRDPSDGRASSRMTSSPSGWSAPSPQRLARPLPAPAVPALRDRADAGRRLAARLGHLRGERVVVVGLPRGGVPVAFKVTQALGAPLDMIVVRGLTGPKRPHDRPGASRTARPPRGRPGGPHAAASAQAAPAVSFGGSVRPFGPVLPGLAVLICNRRVMSSPTDASGPVILEIGRRYRNSRWPPRGACTFSRIA